VQRIVKKFVDGKTLSKAINADEAVAQGAAAVVAMLVHDGSVPEVVLDDIYPLTIGMALHNGLMSRLILRNAHIQTEVTKTYKTANNSQQCVPIRIYEGEVVRDNHLIGELNLTGIASAPKGQTKVMVTVRILEDGTVEVTAGESTGVPISVAID
jgi:molecular chaperone DnaK (HSP70)